VKHAVSLFGKRIPGSLGCLVLLAAVLTAGWIMEERAEKGSLAPVCRVYRDPDHRLPPSNGRLGTNADGLRCSLEAGEIPPGAFVIFFLGDSFVYGAHIRAGEALPQRLEKGLRAALPGREIVVINAGWESSSPLLALRLLQDVGRKYHPDLVLHGFDMTDFRDDLVYRNLLGGRGVYRAASSSPAMLWMANALGKKLLPSMAYRRIFHLPKERFFCVNHPLDETRPDMMPVWRSLLRIHAFCRDELGASFRLLVFPRSFQYSSRESPASWEAAEYTPMGPWVLEPFRFFDERRKEAPFKIHSLLPAFRNTVVFPTCFSDDPHWTPAGVGVAVEDLVATAVDESWLEGE